MADKTRTLEEKNAPIKDVKFDVESILKSKQFKMIERDVLSVLLDEKKEYSIKQVREMLDRELTRTVK